MGSGMGPLCINLFSWDPETPEAAPPETVAALLRGPCSVRLELLFLSELSRFNLLRSTLLMKLVSSKGVSTLVCRAFNVTETIVRILFHPHLSNIIQKVFSFHLVSLKSFQPEFSSYLTVAIEKKKKLYVHLLWTLQSLYEWAVYISRTTLQ